jgi:hypothetical protein
MPKVLNQNQTLNYLADLPLLLGQARSFLDLKNRQGKEIDFEQINQLLRIYALNLTLLSLEEFESLPFEKVFERLEWLFEQEKLIGGGTVPLNLGELEEELSRKKEKEATQAAKQKRLAQEATKLAKDLANRKKLLGALKEARVQTEAETLLDWQTIIENLPENEELANFIQKTAANPELSRQEREAVVQEAWERALEQQELAADTLEAVKQQPLSSETFGLLAGQLKQPPGQRLGLIETLETISKPLAEAQVVEIQKDLTSRLVAYAPLAKDLGWEELAKVVARETQKELPAAPLEKINRVARELAKTAESALPADTFAFEGSLFAPPVIVVDEKVVPFVGSPEIPGNPKGNHWQIKDADNQPSSYYLTTTGTSPAELEKLGKIQQMVSGDPRSPSSQSLSQWAIKLREFQAQYFSQDAIVWQVNRVKAIFNASQILTPLSKISQQAKDWFFQTGFGQSVKLWVAKTSQKSLEALWATAKTGIKTAITKGVTAFLTRIGLQAVANTVAPVIGGLIAFLGEKVIRSGFSLAKRAGGFILSGFGLANVVMEGISGQREVKDASGMGKLAFVGVVGTIVLVAGLGFFDIMNIGGGLLGRGAGGPPSAPGLPVAKPPECQAPRHLAEEVICLLTHPPCSEDQINGQNRESIGVCLDNITMVGSGALAGLKEVLQHYYCYDPPECPLQCLQFVIVVTEALGQSINLDYDHAGAYADSYPSAYKKVSDPRLGDVVVWRGNPGHIGIFIEKVKNSTQILVAEANFDLHGGIGLIQRNGMGFGSGPSAYLRYCPGGNCQ